MRVFVILLISIIAMGCSTSATIYKKDGTSVEARIFGSDSNNIYVDTYLETLNGKEPIKKSDITVIDHPGNIEAVIGAAAIGAAGIHAYAATRPYYETKVFNVAFAVVYGVGGLSMLIGGLSTWNASNNALKSSYNVSEQNSFIRPQIYYVNNKPSFGLNFYKKF